MRSPASRCHPTRLIPCLGIQDPAHPAPVQEPGVDAVASLALPGSYHAWGFQTLRTRNPCRSPE